MIESQKLDSQQVELIGRNLLVGELLRDGLEVARPERDRGIDLIAYVDLDQAGGRFVACPIQVKAHTSSAFAVDRKYERFPGLLLVYLWNVLDLTRIEAYCLSYTEAVRVAEAMGWTKTASWSAGIYSTTRPSERLKHLLHRHRMAPGRWIEKVRLTART